jgi:hypothetical protein
MPFVMTRLAWWRAIGWSSGGSVKPVSGDAAAGNHWSGMTPSHTPKPTKRLAVRPLAAARATRSASSHGRVMAAPPKPRRK